MEEKLCQCCGMPMGETDELYGSEADGSKSKDYCKYCYENGAITFQGTMDQMIAYCVPHVISANPGMTQENAHNMMKEFLPKLKYWKQN